MEPCCQKTLRGDSAEQPVRSQDDETTLAASLTALRLGDISVYDVHRSKNLFSAGSPKSLLISTVQNLIRKTSIMQQLTFSKQTPLSNEGLLWPMGALTNITED